MKTTNNNNNPIAPIVPAVIYTNPGTQKNLIMTENKGKSGVYRWTNLQSDKVYIGSSVNLEKRFRCYYSNPFLSQKKHQNMIIYKAIKKHGISNFLLEILEYSEPSDVIRREQYYLDLFKPEYNINPIAGSSLGYKHSEEAKTLIGKAHKGENHSEETKAKMSAAKKVKIILLARQTIRKNSF